MGVKVAAEDVASKEGTSKDNSFKNIYSLEDGGNSWVKTRGKSRRRHSEASYHRRKSITESIRRTGLFTELFRLNLESKVAMKLYGHHRNIKGEEERQQQMTKWVVHPMSNFRFYWDMLLVLILFFQVLVLPVNIAFYSTDFSASWLIINGCSDIIFIADIVLNFFTGIPDLEDEHMTILNRKQIQVRYLKSWFILDLFSSLPFDYIYFLVQATDSSHTILRASRGIKIFKLTKMLALLRLLRLSRLVRYMRRFEEVTKITSAHLRIIKLISLMLLLSHWSGCMQYLVPYLQDFPESSWIVKNNLKDASIWEKYSWTVFMAMSHMLSIGYGRYPPNNITEVWMIILSMTIGGAFYATFIGGISTVSLAIDSSGRQYTEKIQQVTEYMKYRKLPRSLRNRVHDYYEHRFQRKCFDEEQILKEVSPCLREEILMYHLGGLLRAVPFFNDAEPEFLEEVVILLRFEVYLPGEIICKSGRKGNRMFFIEHGVVEVVTGNNDVTATLSKGAHFGEICLMSKESRRIATVRASTKCDLFSLSSDDFKNVVQDYPEMKEMIRKVAEIRLHTMGISDSLGNIDPEFWKRDIISLASSSNSSDSLGKRSIGLSKLRGWTEPIAPSPLAQGGDTSSPTKSLS